MYYIKSILVVAVFSIIVQIGIGQSINKQNLNDFLTPADTISRKRLNYALTLTGVGYSTFSIGLYHAWYKDISKSRFHTFNDMGEWLQMDKAGHVYSSYFQSVWGYKLAKWTGINDDKAILSGAVISTLVQTTIEVMDGFSEKWGFSYGDMGANLLGVGGFWVQQKIWQEQKITMKLGYQNFSYTSLPIIGSNGLSLSSEKVRAEELYGSSVLENILKDYNKQTYWLSFHPHLVAPNLKWPQWLNISLGYGANNLYGGFENKWSNNGVSYAHKVKDRQRQYFLALDYDLRKIKTKSRFLKSIFEGLNIFKLPAPAIEYRQGEGFIFHLIVI